MIVDQRTGKNSGPALADYSAVLQFFAFKKKYFKEKKLSNYGG
jgi:hypothetical protein